MSRHCEALTRVSSAAATVEPLPHGLTLAGSVPRGECGRRRRTPDALNAAPAYRSGRRSRASPRVYRDATPQSRLARPAPSGPPFHCPRSSTSRTAAGLHRADGLRRRVERQKYILEAIGCGCAFIDYDNDGWMDVFLLTRHAPRRRSGGASNRLYRNNRDGTFTDVTEKAGLGAVGWASGVCVGRLQQRRLRGSLLHVLRPEPPVSQQRRRHLHRRHEGRPDC